MRNTINFQARVSKSLILNPVDSSIPFIDFLGNPVIAIPIGVALSMMLSRGTPRNDARAILLVIAGSLVAIAA